MTGSRVSTVVVAVATALAALATSVAAPMTTATAAEPGSGEPTEQAAVAELEALALARAVVSDHLVASARAEGDRRRAESAVVEAHRLVRVADQDLEHVEAMVGAARESLEAAREAQQVAEATFDTNVATSYKFGGASSSALLLAALQSATDAHDLGRAFRELDGVLGHSYDELGRRIRATAQAQRRVQTLRRLRGVAQRARQEAEAALVRRVDEVDRTLAVARGREAALLDAAARALDAEQVAVDAGADAEQVAASGSGDPLAPAAAAEAEEETEQPSLEERREWLANRRGVVADQARLPAEAWGVRRDLTCPVDGGSFGNDFHFPRSHGRRHLGTDVFARDGTPIVALAGGEVTRIDASDAFDGEQDLGGVTVSWSTDVGRFYAAHLSRIADGLAVGEQVDAGDIVGYVGDTGNARGGAPHLHLGWFVDDVEINPWPTLAYVCDPDGTG